QALSILIPERVNHELPNLIQNQSVRQAVLKLTIRALPWRTPASFTPSTGDLAREAFAKDGWEPMDTLLAVSAHPSALDACWLSDFLASFQIARRDAVWCGYLHKRYEENGIVKRIIDAT